jgi:uncharacterized protein with PIN domain
MKFICDTMLGKLAKHLRILGLDAEFLKDVTALQYYKGQTDAPYFLTRTMKKVSFEKTVLIKSDKVSKQLSEIREIIRPFIDPGKLMNRCIECNVELVDVEKNDIEQKVPEFVFHQYPRFRSCPHCGKVYWEGSHAANMAQFIQEIMKQDGKTGGKRS